MNRGEYRLEKNQLGVLERGGGGGYSLELKEDDKIRYFSMNH